MAIGYMTDVAEADTYFGDERLETAAWDALGALSGDYKEKALQNGYNRIFYCPDYSLPEPADATAAQLIKLKRAQCEMAYYLAVHLLGGDEDRRKGIQAQAVVRAGIVKEDYVEALLAKLPIPPFVDALLAEFKTGTEVVLLSRVGRDEEEGLLEKLDAD